MKTVMGRWSLVLGCWCLGLGACPKRDSAPAVPVGAGGAPAAQPEGPPASSEPGGQLQYAYGHKEKERAAKKVKDEDDSDAEEEALPEGMIVESGVARALAEAAADEKSDDPYAERVLSPAVPEDWPPTTKRLVYFVYPVVVSESGGSKLRSASLEVKVDVSDSSVSTKKIAASKSLGTPKEQRDARTLMTEVEKAEDALIQVLHGTQEVKQVAYLFRAYRDWLEHHQKLGRDLKTRARPFFAWIDKQP